MSIDVEGNSFVWEILSDFEFAKYDIKVFLVEIEVGEAKEFSVEANVEKTTKRVH